jgi:hypothetical protein
VNAVIYVNQAKRVYVFDVFTLLSGHFDFTLFSSTIIDTKIPDLEIN